MAALRVGDGVGAFGARVVDELVVTSFSFFLDDRYLTLSKHHVRVSNGGRLF
jgi:hypothetical protein